MCVRVYFSGAQGANALCRKKTVTAKAKVMAAHTETKAQLIRDAAVKRAKDRTGDEPGPQPQPRPTKAAKYMHTSCFSCTV